MSRFKIQWFWEYCASLGQTARQNRSTRIKTARVARMGWQSEVRFALFIHWGLYSIPSV